MRTETRQQGAVHSMQNVWKGKFLLLAVSVAQIPVTIPARLPDRVKTCAHAPGIGMRLVARELSH